MRIIVAGAGRGGRGLAAHLQRQGHTVTVLDRDAHTVEHATEQIGVVGFVGDATDVATLSQAEPRRADVVVAMLHRDADNLAVAALARSLGAKRVMVRMRDPLYRPVYAAAGAQQIMSETEVLVGALATAIEFEAVDHSMVLGSGAIAVELKVAAGSPAAGRSVSDLANDDAFPPSCVIAGITQEREVQAPRGATVIQPGAELLVVAARADLARTIAMFLGTAPGGEG